ncbi:hypothetical protein ASD15_21910 [Massilia sp. Root351]|uniref:DUF1799 domain-containing protein n=1 Tax=Massilia sp. Root351 TaxID=1736522 RepID=UPI00070E050E|nr:DUF1799 domain-containing protein [Massilia sp. Root351]KQV78471.1 hypothetical protein ASD15_21910 [Massilia sp. Root351]
MIDDDVIAQLEAMHAPAHVIDAAREKLQPVDLDCHVWEENWATVLLFLDVSTQWNVSAGMEGRIYWGLDYQKVESTMRMLGIAQELQPDLFRGLRVMEQAALPLLNERKAR